jgi:hypothetical protein
LTNDFSFASEVSTYVDLNRHKRDSVVDLAVRLSSALDDVCHLISLLDCNRHSQELSKSRRWYRKALKLFNTGVVQFAFKAFDFLRKACKLILPILQGAYCIAAIALPLAL